MLDAIVLAAHLDLEAVALDLAEAHVSWRCNRRRQNSNLK